VGVRRFIGPVLAFSLVISACGPGTSSNIEIAAADLPRATTTTSDATSGATAVNAFGFDLYRLLAVEDTNLVVSPASIMLALGMARAGARGVTATEMDAVMHGAASDEHPGWLNAVDSALASRSGTFEDLNGDEHDLVLRIANAPFAQRGLALQEAYLEALATRFGAGLRLVDYIGAVEEAREQINGWVSEQTEERIPELLEPGVLSEDTRLTLVNAIYLKAPWARPFNADFTAPGAFLRLDGSTVEVPMMTTGGSLPYAEGPGWRAVELPYLGDALAMTVVVPDDLAAFEADLDADAFALMVDALSPADVLLSLPRFSTETKLGLGGALNELGMPAAFDPMQADFSGITTEERLYIGAVIHQANIDVDESGTEAAAATAIVMDGGAAPGEPITLVVDRPFLFALRDTATGAIVFLGRITDPSAAGE
jgi:serine protease inhibitor